MREEGRGIETARLDHRHEAAHSLLTAGTQRRDDSVISEAGCKCIIRQLELARINAKARKRAARTQAAQRIFKCLPCPESFDRNVCAAARQAQSFSHDVALSM